VINTHIPPNLPLLPSIAPRCSVPPATRLIVCPSPILPSHAVYIPNLLPYRINRVSSASAPAATGESFRCRRGAREGEQRSICLSSVREKWGLD